VRRKGDKPAADAADANTGDRSLEGQGGDEQGRGDAVMAITSPSFCLSLASTKLWHCTSSLKLLGNSGRIGRSQRREVSVSFIVGRPSPLDEAAGELSRSSRPLAIVAGEGEEVDAGPPGAGGNRTNDDGLAILSQHGRMGLLGRDNRIRKKERYCRFAFSTLTFTGFACLLLLRPGARLAMLRSRRDASRW